MDDLDEKAARGGAAEESTEYNKRLTVAQKISNSDFLSAVFGTVEAGNNLWACNFKPSPHSEEAKWHGGKWLPGKPLNLRADWNTYYSVAELRPGARDSAHFVRMGVLVADDPDVNTLKLPPSYVLRTSPGKVQVGYILRDTPEARDVVRCASVVKAMVKSGLVDKSGNNPVRYVRLPVGTNTKYDPAYPHNLEVWNPKLRYTLTEAAEAFGVVPVAADSYAGENSQQSGQFNLDAALRDIRDGSNLHDSITRAAASLVASGVPQHTACGVLRSIVENSPARENNDRWNSRITEIERAVASAVLKFAGEFSPHRSEYTEPLDLFPSSELTVPWNPVHYPNIVSAYAEDVASRVGADPLIVAWAMLAAACGVIHDRHKLQVKASDTQWTESARLWVAVVADPSAKKTPAITAVLKPIRELQARWHSDYKEELRRYEEAAAVAKKAKQPPPEKPLPRRVLAGDATIEGLAVILEGNDGGILCEYDELSGWFGSMDAYRAKGVSKDRGFYLQAYNGGEYFIDRAGSGQRFIKNASISIIGGIQPAPMREIARSLQDDGLLQRFICIPARAAGAGSDVAPNISALRAWSEFIELMTDSDLPELVLLSKGAQMILDEARKKISALGQHPTLDQKIRTAIQKGEGQLARLVLVYHFMENREGSCFIFNRAPSETVLRATAEKAVNVYFNLVLPALIKFYTEIVGISGATKDATCFAGHILAHRSNELTPRDLYRAYSEYRGDEHRLRAAVTVLEHAGWVEPIPNGKGSPTKWRVNPRVHIEFPARAEQERERREEIKRQIKVSSGVLSEMSLARAKI